MIDVVETNSIARIADWIELFVISQNKSISKSKIISLYNANSTNVDESDVDGAIQELERRLRLYGNPKPYKIEKNSIYPLISWRKLPAHTLCLIFSTFGASDADDGTKLFEQLTQACVNFFLGCQSINLGFPAGTPFKNHVNKIAETCFEERGADPSPFDKDRGADIVSWKIFGDNRNSAIYLLVQCAAGGNWRSKKPIPLASWTRYILWQYQSTVPGISITQIVDAEKWANAVDDYGVIIDRARIYRLITNKKCVQKSLDAEIISWCKERLK